MMKTRLIHQIIERGMEKVFLTWRFPSFLLLTLFFIWLMVVFMAFVPVSDSAWGAFAEDFKVWCFGYNPETGKMDYMYLVGFTIQPLVLAAVAWFVWREPLQFIMKHPANLKATALYSFILAGLIGASFLILFEQREEPVYEFDPVGLRTALPSPQFELINTREETVNINDFNDKVVILSSVYASCSDTCPLIMEQLKQVLDNLTEAEKNELMVLVVSMQPEKDTPQLLGQMASFYRLDDYPVQMLTGEPDYVHNVLDFMNVARVFDEETYEINHVNLFLLRDKNGKIAYRFSLGDFLEDWMTQALRVLIHENKDTELAEFSS